MSNKIDPKTSRGDYSARGQGLQISTSEAIGFNPKTSVEKIVGRYRFHDKDGEHLHTLDGKPLIGTSTAIRVLNKPLTWWAAGMALTPLGWLNKNKSKVAD